MDKLIRRGALIESLSQKKSIMVAEPDGKHSVSLETVIDYIGEYPTVDAVPVVHGEWMLEAHKEPNYHWSVKAECSNCCHENGEVLGAYFPNVPDSLAKDTALLYASEVKISNFCPECGADMRKDGANDV